MEPKEVDAQEVGAPRSVDVNPPVQPVVPQEPQGFDQQYQQGVYPQYQQEVYQ